MAAILGPKWTSKKIESKVAFGTAVERKLFPVHSTPTRLGIEQGLRGEPHRGPGCYAEDPLSLFLRPMNCRPRSLRGYGFGATRAKRQPIALLNTDPGPAEYQANLAEATKESYKPFLAAQSRFKEPSHTLDHLGPGSHQHNVLTNRKTAFQESFGGHKVLCKIITTKCTNGIPDKCAMCKEVPVGHYYENSKHQVCRECYAKLVQSKGEAATKGMRKVRDCSSIHYHDFPGRPPKTILKSEKEQKKLEYREAYMSLYYS